MSTETKAKTLSKKQNRQIVLLQLKLLFPEVFSTRNKKTFKKRYTARYIRTSKY